MNNIINKVIDLAKDLEVVEYNPSTKEFRHRMASALFKENFENVLDEKAPQWFPLSFAESPERAVFIASQIKRVLNHEGLEEEAESWMWAYKRYINKMPMEEFMKFTSEFKSSPNTEKQ